METIEILDAPEKTSDCVDIINKNYKVAAWKRVKKFLLPSGLCARVFTDGIEYCSIVNERYRGANLYTDCNISNYSAEITAIETLCKSLWTWDYGETFYNPITKALWISGGDGGVFHTNKSVNQVNKMLEDDEENDGESVIEEMEKESHLNNTYYSKDIEKFILKSFPIFNSVNIEAECSPDSDKYIYIGNTQVFE